MEERSTRAEDGEEVGEPPGPTRAGAPPAGGAPSCRVRRRIGREGGRERERKVREKWSQRQVREGGREEEGGCHHCSPFTPNAIAPIRVGRKTERGEERERGGERIWNEKREPWYIFGSRDSKEKREKRMRNWRS